MTCTTSTSTDATVAQEEVRANESQASTLVVNQQNPPLTDRERWPACDGR